MTSHCQFSLPVNYPHCSPHHHHRRHKSQIVVAIKHDIPILGAEFEGTQENCNILKKETALIFSL